MDGLVGHPNVGKGVAQIRDAAFGVDASVTTTDWGLRTGHMGAGDQFGGLTHLLETGKVRPGDRVLLSGAGAVWNFGAAVLEITAVPTWPATAGEPEGHKIPAAPPVTAGRSLEHRLRVPRPEPVFRRVTPLPCGILAASPREETMAQLPPNPTLKSLEPLIGQWTLRVPEFSDDEARVTFEWLESGAFLRIHSAPPPPIPTAVQLISRDDATGTYTVLYYDSRGVSRVYQMTFEHPTWKIWRNAPGFDQRFTATLSPDARTIEATWEKSLDNATWQHDFNLIYTKTQ